MVETVKRYKREGSVGVLRTGPSIIVEEFFCDRVLFLCVGVYRVEL